LDALDLKKLNTPWSTDSATESNFS